MSVTAAATSKRRAKSRNAQILAEWKAEEATRAERRQQNPEAAAAIDGFVAALNGGEEVGERERRARSFAGYARCSAAWCSQCKREFDVGQTVYRTRRVPTDFRSRGFYAVCLTCVCSWHASWMKAAKKPVPCEGQCGVYVTSPYSDIEFWDRMGHEDWRPYARYCSTRCCERAAKARRSLRAERTCSICGETFTPKRADARYCSNACRQDAYRKRKLEAAA